MLVARTHFLEPCGVRIKTFDCCDGWREEYMGYTMTWTDREILEHGFAHILYRHRSPRQLACIKPYRRT